MKQKHYGLCISRKGKCYDSGMANVTENPWVLAATAVITGLYDVASFFGLPPFAHGPVAQTAALLIFALSLVRIITTQHKELIALRDPIIRFSLSATETTQNDQQLRAVHRRIRVKNDSAVAATSCELAIESWTFSTSGLNPDTPLHVKDAPDNVRRTDINRQDTKQFDLFITRLDWNTAQVEVTFVGAPNCPTVTTNSQEEGHSMVLRLTGSNFKVRRYKVLLLIGNQNVKITRLDELKDVKQP